MKEKDNEGNTDLMLAAKKGHYAVVKYLLEKGASEKEKDNEGNTALMLAAKNGHIDVVKVLLCYGADVNAKDKDNLTVVMWLETRIYELVGYHNYGLWKKYRHTHSKLKPIEKPRK